MNKAAEASASSHGLVRRLGLFDATMLVMGGIIGSGIFVNPAEVARHVERRDTDRLGTHLREQFETAIVPGRWFEMPDYFRVGLGLPTADFEEGLSRLGRALDDLK